MCFNGLMDVVKVRGLQKSYCEGFFLKKRQVLKDVSFSLKQGRMTGFLGDNGSGKTTTMKCLLGLSFADKGEMIFFGSKNLNVKTKSKIGFLPEQPYFYQYLTGFEFLKFFGSLSSSWKKSVLVDRIHLLLKQVSLFEKKDQLLRTYSRGMLQRIGMAQALIHEPELLILDEPLGGLDPFGRKTMMDLMKDVVKKGASLFFSSHLLHDAEFLCQDLVILKKGRVIYSGDTNHLLNQIESYIQIKCRQGDNIKEVKVKNEKELQEKIDDLRKKKNLILEVKRQNQTLEEAFTQLNSLSLET